MIQVSLSIMRYLVMVLSVTTWRKPARFLQKRLNSIRYYETALFCKLLFTSSQDTLYNSPFPNVPYCFLFLQKRNPTFLIFYESKFTIRRWNLFNVWRSGPPVSKRILPISDPLFSHTKLLYFTKQIFYLCPDCVQVQSRNIFLHFSFAQGNTQFEVR